MVHQNVYKQFELYFPNYYKHVEVWFPNGGNSIRVAFDNDMSGVFIDRFGRDIAICPSKREEWSEITVDIAMSDQFLGWIFALLSYVIAHIFLMRASKNKLFLHRKR